MPNDPSTIETTSTVTSLPSAFANTEWMKLFPGAPARFCASLGEEVLTFTARRLQAQADYVGKLAACSNPSELLACNTDFLQKSTANWVEEGQRVFDKLREFSTTSKGN